MAASEGRLIIVVPGGGSQRDEHCTSLPPWVTRRLDHAAMLYFEELKRLDSIEPVASGLPNEVHRPQKQKEDQHPIIVVLSAGTTHRPNYVNGNGWPIAEATSEAYYLLQWKGGNNGIHLPPNESLTPPCTGNESTTFGIESKYIYRETASLDTIGNFYFFRTSHLEPHRRLHCDVGVRQTSPACWNPTIKVVTSAFHLPRTKAICNWLLSLPANPLEVQLQKLCNVQCRHWSVEYHEVSDEGIDPIVIKERLSREEVSLANFNRMIGEGGEFHRPQQQRKSQQCDNESCEVITLADVQEWLYTQHTAYCTHNNMTPAQNFSNLSSAAMKQQRDENNKMSKGLGAANPENNEVSEALLSSY